MELVLPRVGWATVGKVEDDQVIPGVGIGSAESFGRSATETQRNVSLAKLPSRFVNFDLQNHWGGDRKTHLSQFQSQHGSVTK